MELLQIDRVTWRAEYRVGIVAEGELAPIDRDTTVGDVVVMEEGAREGGVVGSHGSGSTAFVGEQTVACKAYHAAFDSNDSGLLAVHEAPPAGVSASWL